MRSGFSVCAKAFKCQVLFPRKLPRPTTCKRRFATLLSLETLAEYSRTSPGRRGNPVSTGGKTFFESAGSAGTGDFTPGALTGFFAGGASRKPGGSADTTSGGGCCPRTWSQKNAAAAQPSAANAARPTVVLRLMLF